MNTLFAGGIYQISIHRVPDNLAHDTVHLKLQCVAKDCCRMLLLLHSVTLGATSDRACGAF